MATNHRLIMDIVAEEQFTDNQLQRLSRQLTELAHTILMDQEHQAYLKIDKFAHGHVHEVGDGSRCSWCVEFSRDYRSGDGAVENG